MKEKARSKIEKECPTCHNVFNPWATHENTQIFCKLTCIRRDQAFKDKISASTMGVGKADKGKRRPYRAGDKCHFWRGGVSVKNRTERQNVCSTIEYKNFRNEVLKRDNYKCVFCGDYSYKGRGTHCKLIVDHIKPYSLFPELRIDVSNARTLCHACNIKTETYGTRVLRFTRKDFE